jgi:hypothetical protein
MARELIGGTTPHVDREQYGSVLRRAFPLGLHSFEKLDLDSPANGPGSGMETRKHAKILDFR